MSQNNSPAGLEVEVKVRLKDRAAFAATLPNAGFHLETPETLERNALYDTCDNQLRQRRQLLRIRRYGDSWLLTHKAPAGSGPESRHKSRVETETPIADGDKLATIFEALGYRRIFVYEKFRTEWADGAGHIVIDKTPIGDFAELEGTPAWIDATAARLGISTSQYLTESYSQLFQDWKDANKHAAANMTFHEVGDAR